MIADIVAEVCKTYLQWLIIQEYFAFLSTASALSLA
jgi:hypothetical protein